jgi:hypothetical protein
LKIAKLFDFIVLPSIILLLIAGLALNATYLHNQRSLQSPGDTITGSAISLYPHTVGVNFKDGAYLFNVSDTGSMRPTFDSTSKIIATEVVKESDLHIGDIAVYLPKDGVLTAHRIVGIGMDSKGTYYALKGDRNLLNDPNKIRPDQIKYKVAMVIY